MMDEKALGERIIRSAALIWPGALAFCDIFIFGSSMIIVACASLALGAAFIRKRWDWRVLMAYGILLILLGVFQKAAALGSRFSEYGFWFLASGIMAGYFIEKAEGKPGAGGAHIRKAGQQGRAQGKRHRDHDVRKSPEARGAP